MSNETYSCVVGPDPIGSFTLKRIEQWIDKCERHCSDCSNNSTLSTYSYPTRLIDVSQPPLRLILTRTLPKEDHLPYIALSHCWGGGRGLITTRESILERMRGIPMTALPATFQDAVALTRRLKIRYLWVDCLCIIQDDREDWRIESSRMCDVYSNAYLTIAATLASDDGQGFLRHRPSTLACIDLSFSEKETIRIFLQPETTNNDYYSDPCDGPLDLRAWTLQERLLSRRVLGFAWNQLFWECRGHVLQKESGHRSVPPGYLEILKPFETGEDLKFRWHRLVEEYSGRRLTDPFDKLVALDGLVKRFAATSDDVYVAGLWKRHLLDDLLWRPYPGSSHARCPVYRSPSWSWASMDGPVWFHERKEWRNVSHAVIEEINVENSVEDGKAGAVSGYIVVQGSVLDIQLRTGPLQGLNVNYVTVTFWNIGHVPTSSSSVPVEQTATIDVVLDDKGDYLDSALKYTGIILNIQMRLKEPSNGLAGFEKCRAVGLLLRRTEDVRLTTTPLFVHQEPLANYMRIGVFESEWLDMWTLQQLCTCTRRERMKLY